MSSPLTTKTELQQVADAIRERDRFLLATHENPDGDALGSIVATKLALERLGKDVAMYLQGRAPLPREYAFMDLSALHREPPPDAAERTVLAVDCASAFRVSRDPSLLERAAFSINVDHHHDNTRFAAVNLVVAEASSTGEILHDLFEELGVALSPEISEALYIAIVTDTGRFQYANTTPKTLRLAAELIESGADFHGVFQHVYESMELAQLKLLARAIDHAQVLEGGRLIVSYLTREDYAALAAGEAYSEGIIEWLRALEGAELAALIREPPALDERKVSLRAAIDELDVSAIARLSGGGGHRQAAGFSSLLSIPEITDFVHREYLAARGDGARAG